MTDWHDPVDILMDADLFETPPALFEYTIGVRPADELAYEQWIHPLRVAPELALRWEHDEFAHAGYVWYEPRGLAYSFDSGNVYRGHSAECCMKETMHEEKETVTVVLRSDVEKPVVSTEG